MLDQIFSLFKKQYQLGHMSALMGHISNVINIFHQDFLKDADAKNAAIDALCELLQQHKDQPEGKPDEKANP